MGLCAMLKSVRKAEEVFRDQGGRYFSRIGRTALSDLLSRLSWEEVRAVLRRAIHGEIRRKALSADGLPIGVVAIDGKTNWTGPEEVNEYCQRSSLNDDIKTPYWSFRVVRAVLISAAAKVCVDEAPIPADTNDMGVFKDFFLGLIREYGRSALFEMVTADAGFCSLANATTVDDEGYAYVFGLKGNQADLHEQARRVLLPLAESTPPEAETDWKPEKGRKVKRRLWRTRELAHWLDWTHLRQVWLVRKVRQEADGSETVIEDRFFVTNLPVNRLTASECLAVVRRHWGIENDCFWTLDTQWEEDAGLWVRKGNGLLVCSLLRMIAYNLMVTLREVHAKADHWRRKTWQGLAGLMLTYLSLVSLAPRLRFAGN
jgi:predicted transposase YbfD/YdcC